MEQGLKNTTFSNACHSTHCAMQCLGLKTVRYHTYYGAGAGGSVFIAKRGPVKQNKNPGPSPLLIMNNPLKHSKQFTVLNACHFKSLKEYYEMFSSSHLNILLS